MKQYRQLKGYLEAKGYWEILVYLFFGGLATIVNFVSFALARQYFDLSMALSNSISWFCSVLFAFVTNKLWVFHSNHRILHMHLLNAVSSSSTVSFLTDWTWGQWYC